jgi:hypothetical protein
MTEEHPFHCPNCGAPITMLLDVSVPGQEYIEDCEVCCAPLVIAYAAEAGEITAFSASCADE